MASSPTQARAERLARLDYPELLLAGLYAAVASAALRLTNALGAAVAIGVALAWRPFAEQFYPGRIDHHSVDIVLLVAAASAMMRALDAAPSRVASLAALAIAVSLGISIETMPLLVLIASALPLAFVVQGKRHAPALAQFALALGGATLLIMIVTSAPSLWDVPVCDAASAPHHLAIALGACGLFVVAQCGHLLTSVVARLSAVARVAIARIAAVTLLYPGCLGDPFVAVDPLVRANWLDHVSEAIPAWRLLAHEPATVLVRALPLMALLIAGLQRTITVSAAIGHNGYCSWPCCWPAASCAPCRCPISTSSHRSRPSSAARWRCGSLPPPPTACALCTPIWAFTLCLPFAPPIYGAFDWTSPHEKPASAGGNSVRDDSDGAPACFRPETLKSLNALAPSLLLGPLDSGGYLLADTHHAVLAGAYHRNNRGNRLAIEIFTGPINDAEARLRASGARYVVMCREQSDVARMAQHAPDGLLAGLRDGHVPSWLRAVPVTGAPLQVYELAGDVVRTGGLSLRGTITVGEKPSSSPPQ